MIILIVVLLGVHVLTSVLWAGSTFTLAHGDAAWVSRLFRVQMLAAVLSVLAGGALWGILHKGPMGGMERTLAIGVVCAIAAAGVQGALNRSRPLLGQRIAAVLLAVTLLCMTLARYTP